MDDNQMIHVGMINSFNVITKRNTLDEVMNSSVPVLTHEPNKDVPYELIEFMVYYFGQYEMYENCAKLKKYIKQTYNDDGSFKFVEEECDCEFPSIETYEVKTRCANCNKILKR